MRVGVSWLISYVICMIVAGMWALGLIRFTSWRFSYAREFQEIILQLFVTQFTTWIRTHT